MPLEELSEAEIERLWVEEAERRKEEWDDAEARPAEEVLCTIRSRLRLESDSARPNATAPHNILDLGNWEEFEERLKELQMERTERQRKSGRSSSELLYRGQEDSNWTLSTTLERSKRERMSIAGYYLLISRVQPQVETFTGSNWNLPEWFEVKKLLGEFNHQATQRPSYEYCLQGDVYSYMVHLRHNGFPSPLLDWTRSPYIAAFFAFRRAIESEQRVSIYAFCESPGGFKTTSSDEPRVNALGPYVRTHRRHFLQQCQYTICVVFNSGAQGWRFVTHETVLDRPTFRARSFPQDVLWKFNIPSTERLKVLRLLNDDYNINAFSLFGSEESLMETMALRELDLRPND